MLVAIRFKIEILRYLLQALIADAFYVFLHETVIDTPLDAGGAHGSLLGAGRDLMGVQIMQSKLIDQRLFDFFMQDQKPVGLHGAAAELERFWHVPVDIDDFSVKAIAGEIGNVVLAIELFDAAHDGVERAFHHQAGNVPFRQPQPFVRSSRMTKLERHGFTPRGWSRSRRYKSPS